MSRITTAESALQQANSLFVDDNFEEALTHYSEAIELDENNAETFIKRSTCYYKLEKFEESLNDANSALKLEAKNAKAQMRKGMALFSLEEYEAAKAAFEAGQSIDPNNSQFRTWIRKCAAELETEVSDKPATVVDSKPQSAAQTTPKPTEPTVAQPVQETKPEPKFRHEWYQTPTHISVTVFAKGISKEQTNINIQESSLSVVIKISENNEYVLDLDLFDKVVPAECSTFYGSTKIEVKMKKASSMRWPTLEHTGEKRAAQFDVSSTTSAAPKPKKNWDKIVDEVAKGENLDGEDALNKVFQDIYSNGSEEQRRAMIKSFTESGGTVLSTNWDDVGKGQVKGSPPDGLEMHKWEELAKGK